MFSQSTSGEKKGLGLANFTKPPLHTRQQRDVGTAWQSCSGSGPRSQEAAGPAAVTPGTDASPASKALSQPALGLLRATGPGRAGLAFVNTHRL